ncbi:hypothetical protein RND71_012448 [Anisodus tanguticus]|uniref:Uncharacterized protein n=1 Tax=Anisodus tanguticus TaxID=243964 RepID=A0AAE1SFA1_9SOLA|nr:hypothetical protein RND71_012448 [Anisodus tanguticus]
MSTIRWQTSRYIRSQHMTIMAKSALPGWDVYDSSQLQRETKRSRINGPLPYDSSYPHKRTNDRGPVLDEQYGLGPFGSNVPSGPVTVSQAKNTVSPQDARISPGQHHFGHDSIFKAKVYTKKDFFELRLINTNPGVNQVKRFGCNENKWRRKKGGR